MALGTPTLDAQAGEKPGAPTFVFNLSFLGDDSYPTGGTAAFQQFVRDALNLSPAVEVMAIIPNDCDGFVPVYDKAADTLKVYYADYDAGADGALIEVANATALNGSTFNVTVLAK